MPSFRPAAVLVVCVVMSFSHTFASDFEDCEVCVSIVEQYNARHVCAESRLVSRRRGQKCNLVKKLFRDNYVEFMESFHKSGVNGVCDTFMGRIQEKIGGKNAKTPQELCILVAIALPKWEGACAINRKTERARIEQCIKLDKLLRHAHERALSVLREPKTTSQWSYDKCNSKNIKNALKIDSDYVCGPRSHSPGEEHSVSLLPESVRARRSVFSSRQSLGKTFAGLMQAVRHSVSVIKKSVPIQQHLIRDMSTTLQTLNTDLKDKKDKLMAEGIEAVNQDARMRELEEKENRPFEVVSGVTVSMVNIIDVVRIDFVEKIIELYEISNKCVREMVFAIPDAEMVINRIDSEDTPPKFQIQSGLEDETLRNDIKPLIAAVGTRVSKVFDCSVQFKESASEDVVQQLINDMADKIRSKLEEMSDYLLPQIASVFNAVPLVSGNNDDSALPENFNVENYFKDELPELRKSYTAKLEVITNAISSEVDTRENDSEKKWGGLRGELAKNLDALIEDMRHQASVVKEVKEVYHQSKNRCVFAQAALRQLIVLSPEECQEFGDELNMEARANRFLCKLVAAVRSLAEGTNKEGRKELTCQYVHLCEEGSATVFHMLDGAVQTLQSVKKALQHERRVNKHILWTGNESKVKKEFFDAELLGPGVTGLSLMKELGDSLREDPPSLKAALMATRRVFTSAFGDDAASQALRRVKAEANRDKDEFLFAVRDIVNRQLRHLRSVLDAAIHETGQLDLGLHGLLGTDLAQEAVNRAKGDYDSDYDSDDGSSPSITAGGLHDPRRRTEDFDNRYYRSADSDDDTSSSADSDDDTLSPADSEDGAPSADSDDDTRSDMVGGALTGLTVKKGELV